jgi:hypothetical protein
VGIHRMIDATPTDVTAQDITPPRYNIEFIGDAV